jgi:hypothetical protein
MLRAALRRRGGDRKIVVTPLLSFFGCFPGWLRAGIASPPGAHASGFHPPNTIIAQTSGCLLLFASGAVEHAAPLGKPAVAPDTRVVNCVADACCRRGIQALG